jgi:hypothetical protein
MNRLAFREIRKKGLKGDDKKTRKEVRKDRKKRKIK